MLIWVILEWKIRKSRKFGSACVRVLHSCLVVRDSLFYKPISTHFLLGTDILQQTYVSAVVNYIWLKFHAGPSGIQKKAFRHCLLSRITLIRNCQNLDYIAFQKIKFSFIDFWNDGMNAKHTFTQVGSGWLNFK